MKLFVILALLLICSHEISLAQTNKYKYQYVFTMDDPGDSTSLIVDSIIWSCTADNFHLHVKNNVGQIVPFSTVSLTSTETKYTFAANQAGKVDTLIKPGKYHLTISAFGYKEFDRDISINGITWTIFYATMARGPIMDSYEIHSTKRLSKQEIQQIKECREGKRQTGCEEKKYYFVTIQI